MQETKLQLFLHLLRSQGTNIAVRCLQVLREPQTTTTFTQPVPTGEVLHIYKVRSRINRQNGGAIQGFDALIIALSETRQATVTVVSIEGEQEGFIAFTDKEIGEFLGILQGQFAVD